MISIIIPVINEEGTIVTLLDYISKNSTVKNISEVIVVDGGSQDKTLQIIDFFIHHLLFKNGLNFRSRPTVVSGP